MKSIGTKFSLTVGGFAIVFSSIILYWAWSTARDRTEEQRALQAELAMAFETAIQEYAAETIRPAMEKRIGKDEFVVEAMSTSFIARNVFDKVRNKLPEYVIKFSSDRPRNPANLAGVAEMQILEYFRAHPQESRWAGKLTMNGCEYLAHMSALRIEQQCLDCHGRPDDAPKALRQHYGKMAGFNRQLGDVAGMTMIAIPMDQVQADLRAHATTNILATVVCLVFLFAAILVAFRYLVTRRLSAITRHFQEAACLPGNAAITSVPDRAEDEIGMLARSFNAMAARLRDLYDSLEERVRQRTAEVQREQETLRHLLRSSDHERQLIGYEIHDGLAQHLAAARMQLESYARLQQEHPAEAAKAYSAGIKLLCQSHAEARRLINGVRPPILDEAGVVAAIEHLICEQQASAEIVQIEFHKQVDFNRLVPVLENAIFRIVQEGLSNALKHSQSKKVWVEVVQVGNELQVVIQDWGVGFQVQKEQEGCFGLEGIRERARLLGGTANIETALGNGTRILVRLPVVLSENRA
jgi:signal transduction histidine kinase